MMLDDPGEDLAQVLIQEVPRLHAGGDHFLHRTGLDHPCEDCQLRVQLCSPVLLVLNPVAPPDPSRGSPTLCPARETARAVQRALWMNSRACPRR
jgi:hypothetical protein